MTRKIAIMGEGDAESGRSDPPLPILQAAGADFTPELVNVPNSAFPATPDIRLKVATAYLDEGINLAQRGYEALYINTVGDYGLKELRSAVDIPVVGSGEASVRLAQILGGAFSIVTIWPPSLGFIYDHVLEDSNARSSCRGITHLSDDDDLDTLADEENFVTDMQACHLTTMTKIRAACSDALKEDGANRIILGCTCMEPVAATLKQEGFPIVEPMSAGYRLTELLLSL